MSSMDEATKCIQELNGIVSRTCAVSLHMPDPLHNLYPCIRNSTTAASVLIIRSLNGLTHPRRESTWDTAATATVVKLVGVDVMIGTAIVIIARTVIAIATMTVVTRTGARTETAIGAMTATATAVARALNTLPAVATPVAPAPVDARAPHPAATGIPSGEEKTTRKYPSSSYSASKKRR